MNSKQMVHLTILLEVSWAETVYNNDPPKGLCWLMSSCLSPSDTSLVEQYMSDPEEWGSAL